MSVAVISPADLEAIVERVMRRVAAELQPKRPDPELTTDQVAAELGCAEKTVRKHAREGLLKGRRRGQEWRFTRAAIDAYRAGGLTAPASVAGDILAKHGRR